MPAAGEPSAEVCFGIAHAAPIVTSLEDLRDVRHITELHGQEALG